MRLLNTFRIGSGRATYRVSDFMDLTKTLVIGNSGSGKSWLSEHIANHLNATWVDLDLIHWYPGGYNVARRRENAIQLARKAANAERGVIEGIYGWLVCEVQSNATALIWLCPDEAECAVNIRQRGIRRGGDEQSFAALLRWAETYRVREGSSSHAAHELIFNGFAGTKICLRDRDEITNFAERAADQRTG
jgi:adenylate kinase family enzyme